MPSKGGGAVGILFWRWLIILLGLVLFLKPVSGHAEIELKDSNKVAIIELKKPMPKEDIEEMVNRLPGLKLRYVFRHIFPGFSVSGTDEDLQKLTSIGTSYQVHPSFTYTLQFQKWPIKEEMMTINSIAWIGTEKVRYLTDKRGRRLTGKGIKVGIIDTGIDYTHPDLRKAYKKGYDFVDHDEDPMETVGQGPYNTFHGTHVAGVIAARGFMTGVAPDVEIYAYRALGPGGSGTTEQIIAAIDRAIADQVDVLNLSLGMSVNGPDLPVSKALDAAVRKGIVAVTSSGNSGPELWTVGSPGTSQRAISVGASTPLLTVPYLEYGRERFRLVPLANAGKWARGLRFELIDGSEGFPEDLKNARGKLVLIRRGNITFTEKAENAKAAGAQAVIIYNNIDGNLLAELEKEVDLPVAVMTKNDGERLLELIDQKIRGNIIFEKEADQLADFSSRGPVTHTWDVKPDVVAPGVAIVSTVPGGYMALQGTSMASPHVAGACALIKQAHPDWSPDEIKAVLMNTSKPLLKNENEVYYPYEQGAGRIQLDKALASTTIVQPATLLFGQTDGSALLEAVKPLTVENKGDRSLRYTFRIPRRSDLINWHFPPPFYLKPGERREIPVKMEVKTDHKENEIFNGYIEMDAGTERITIPYLYVTDEPDYPRIMSFVIGEADRPGWYRYEVYLPRGADELGIILLDPDTKRFIASLDMEKNVRRGLVTKDVKADVKIPRGSYLAVAFAKKGEREDYMEQFIDIWPVD